MTVFCMCCGKFLYEKCFNCRDTQAIEIPKQFKASPQRYRCPKGHPTWIQGQDVKFASHGICGECSVAMRSIKPAVSRRAQ